MSGLSRWREPLAGLGGGGAFLVFHLALGGGLGGALAGLAAAAAVYLGLRLVIPPPGAPGAAAAGHPLLALARPRLIRLAALLPALDPAVAGPVGRLVELAVATAERAEATGELPAAARRLLGTYLETALRIVEHDTALRRDGIADHGARVAALMTELADVVRAQSHQGAGGARLALEAELALLDRTLTAEKLR